MNEVFGENLTYSNNHKKGEGKVEFWSADNFNTLKPPAGSWVAHAFFVVVAGAFIVLVGRAFFLQIVRSESYELLAEQNQFREEIIYAERGVIKDRNGEIIVRNRPGYILKLDNRRFLLAEEDEKNLVADIIGSPPRALEERINEDFGKGVFYSILKTDIEREKALEYISEFRDGSLLFVESIPIRDNLYPLETSHIMGYLGEIQSDELVKYPNFLPGEMVGKEGIERTYEETLHGVSGVRRIKLSALGEVLDVHELYSKVDGESLDTNIDLDLQLYAYEIVEEAALESGGESGALVALEPSTGRVISLVSYPSFNPNKFSSGISHAEYNRLLNDKRRPLNNRVIAGLYPPGSTFKIVTASGVLEEGIMPADRAIDGAASVRIGEFEFRDWNPAGHGPTDIYRAIARSVDTYFYKVAGGIYEVDRGLGVNGITKWAKNYGLGKPTGIDIKGEVGGVVPTPEWKEQNVGEPWYIGNTLHYSIGQSYLLTTPLQVANFTAAIANGGVIYTPRLVGQDSIPRDVGASPNTIEKIRKGIIMACSPGGTAYPLYGYPVEVACKTGTSEFGIKDEQGKYQLHAWLTAYAPVENPEIVVTVIIEGGGEGSDTAAPVVKKYLDRYFGFEEEGF